MVIVLPVFKVVKSRKTSFARLVNQHDNPRPGLGKIL
jgi:hypothetical protein